MSKKMLIDATHPEETRVVVVDGNRVEEFDFENLNRRQLSGNIYLAKVTRVEPSLQAAFVDYGGNRHGFLAFSEIHPDYYQIPVADREALLAEERARNAARADDDHHDDEESAQGPASMAEKAADDPAVHSEADEGGESEEAPHGMELIDLDGDEAGEADGGIEAYESEGAERPARRRRTSSRRARTQAVDEDHAEADDPAHEIESIGAAHADESDAEDAIRHRPRLRRYKIQEVIKVRQIMLVQVVKEERGNKGAALTTYLSLPGRYCVLMPNTARGGGISRKITSATDRKKLKSIAAEISVPQGAGLIIRTAGAKRTKAEIKRDYEFLGRTWEQVRELTLKSVAPALIYEEGDLIKRSIRDLYSREIEEVLVEGEAGYRTAKDFMRLIMPSHAKQVQKYDDPIRLFARYQVESFLGDMLNPVVQLKSGGYLVIGITEALVAIDVNSGRATKEGSIEETALKTNLEAADEVARQLRLRDLAGLIVIDFIDMEERKNNAAVEKRLKESLKTDRARIQVGRISGFGLMEMSRQRLHPSMLESTTQACPHCHGTGLIRSDDSMALAILRALEEEGARRRSKEVLLKAPVNIVNYLFNYKRDHIALIEANYGMIVRMEADPSLITPDYEIEKFKTASRPVAETAPLVVSGDSALIDAPPAQNVEAEEEAASEKPDQAARGDDSDDGNGKRRRRRRRRGKGGQNEQGGSETAENESNEAPLSGAAEIETGHTLQEELAPEESQPGSDEAESASRADDAPAEKKTRARTPTKSRSARKAAAPEDSDEEEAGAESAAIADIPSAEEAGAPESQAADVAEADVAEISANEPAGTPAPDESKADDVADTPDPEPAPKKAPRTGWWSFG